MMKNRSQARQKFYSKSSISYSVAHKCVAVFDSDLEADFFNLILFSNYADDFQMQPDHIRYQINEDLKMRRYTPDAVLVNDGIATYIEVKYEAEANKPELLQKHQLIRETLNKQGHNFIVLTEKFIRCGHRASNLCYLKPALSYPAPIEELQTLLCFTKKTAMSISDFKQLQHKHDAKDCLVRRAIAHKLIQCDLTLQWDELTLDFAGFLSGENADV